MIQLPPSPTLDPWASFDDDDGDDAISHSHAERNGGPSYSTKNSPMRLTTKSGNATHPLYTDDARRINGVGNGLDVLGDVSRPALTRLTSETERQVAESSRSGSERGSLDLLRMSTANAGTEEVEVLIHKVKADESIAGISLLYGVDVATLRKINKLWASDPVHLRTHLYVPLEACKWTKARDTFTRGPGDGQVTLTAKDTRNKGKGKGKQQESPKLIDIDYDAWQDSAKEFMPSTNLNYGRTSLDVGRISLDNGHLEEEEEEPSVRVLDIVRIPRSQLQFFPKQKPPDPRKSLDSPLRKSTSARHLPRRPSELADGPSIQNDLSTLPSPLQPRAPPSSKPVNKVVRLRPPNGSSPILPAADTFVNRISSLFTVPPPPPVSSQLFPSRRASGPRSTPASGASSPSYSVGHQDVPLELRPRTSFEVPKRNGNGKHRTASASKKFD